MNNGGLQTLDVGQANELKLALRRAGYSNGEVKKLCEGTILAEFRDVLLGYAEVKTIAHVVNLDADPFVPAGWKVEKHEKGGSFKWHPKDVQFYLSRQQRRGETIKGDKLRRKLMGKPVMNANLLDYLLANPHLIPEDWKRDEQECPRFIFFWGTVYRDLARGDYGSLCVRCLYWGGDKWCWGRLWLDNEFDVQRPAALHALRRLL